MRSTKIQRVEIDMEELRQILARARSTALSQEDAKKLSAALETLGYLTQALEEKGTSIARLRKLLFGSSSEKTSKVLGGDDSKEGGEKSEDGVEKGESSRDQSGGADGAQPGMKKKRKGHGRNGAAAYSGAQRVTGLGMLSHPRPGAMSHRRPGSVSHPGSGQAEPPGSGQAEPPGVGSI